MAAAVVILTAALLAAGIIAVPLRLAGPPAGYDQKRAHWNTKNTTRFGGGSLEEIAVRVSRAVFPATTAENTPDIVLLYEPADWQSALQAASLLKILNALLLPATDASVEEIRRLRPRGSAGLNGARVLFLQGADLPLEGLAVGRLDRGQINPLRVRMGEAPRHALVVDPNDPETALLAAPWAAYSGDPVFFNTEEIQRELPRFALGEAAAGPETRRIRASSPEATAVRFAGFSSPEHPLFGWGMNADNPAGYRSFTLARPSAPEIAALSANLALRGKPGPLLWSGERELPQVVNDYLFSQRAAFWVTPSEGPFHHFYILGDSSLISFPAQGQADYAVEIGPYLGKGAGLSGFDMVAAAWVLLGIASALWIAFHESRVLPQQNWVMRYAWPLMALMSGPFGILFYYVSYHRPVVRAGPMLLWDRPLWNQSLAATVSAVGFGASLMIASGFVLSFFGLPLLPMRGPLFFLGSPMILQMIVNYAVAVLVSWPLFQTPMMAMFHGLDYRRALGPTLPMVLISMAAAAAAMNPAMWAIMMWHLPMMPSEESIQWFGIMFFTGFAALLLAWPFNHLLVRRARKGGLM
jgi:hypothetical protein